MNARGMRRYVDDLLRGRRPTPFAPDDFEAAQIRTAIELRAARRGPDAGDAPSQEFLTALHRRLAEQMHGAQPEPAPKQSTTRRQVIVGTSAAAGAAGAAVGIDRAVLGNPPEGPAVAGQLTPNDGSWQRIAASSDVPDSVMHPFDLGSVTGFVRRVDGKPQAISRECARQGWKLWFDVPDKT